MTYIAAVGIAPAITAPLDSYVVRVANYAGSPDLGKKSCLLRNVKGAHPSVEKRRPFLSPGRSIPRTATAGKNRRETRGRALPNELGPWSHSWYPVTNIYNNDFRTHLSSNSQKSLCINESALRLCIVVRPWSIDLLTSQQKNFNQNNGHGAFSEFYFRVALMVFFINE